MKKTWTCLLAVISLGILAGPAGGQQKTVNIALGNFDQWTVREITESAVIGGDTRSLYEIAPNDTIKGDIPYRRNPRSPWATSNVMAKVSGITKCSVTVFPEARGTGRCARLDTRLENCKVLGIVNITVLASGSIFLGDVVEPIKDTKNPQSKLNMGVPFTERPKALLIDYKFKTDGKQTRTKATGFSAMRTVPGPDYADVILLLQKRWEDAAGNVFAKRVGTANERFGKNTPNWVNGYSIPVRYGNITNDPAFTPQMGLIPEEQSKYCRNSKGQMVPIREVGWADADEQPTHMILQMSSSYDGAYVGSIGNSLWVDNVKLAY